MHQRPSNSSANRHSARNARCPANRMAGIEVDGGLRGQPGSLIAPHRLLDDSGHRSEIAPGARMRRGSRAPHRHRFAERRADYEQIRRSPHCLRGVRDPALARWPSSARSDRGRCADTSAATISGGDTPRGAPRAQSRRPDSAPTHDQGHGGGYWVMRPWLPLLNYSRTRPAQNE
jgi:hypothetical protein